MERTLFFNPEHKVIAKVNNTSEEKTAEKQGLTIRQLYEMAKKANALDIPINWFYTCDDDWYSEENEPLKKSEVEITETEVNFYL